MIADPNKFADIEPIIQKTAGTRRLNMTVPIHNDMPFNPLDVSLAQQSPNQQWLKTFVTATYSSLLPGLQFADPLRRVNDTNFVSTLSSFLHVM